MQIERTCLLIADFSSEILDNMEQFAQKKLDNFGTIGLKGVYPRCIK